MPAHGTTAFVASPRLQRLARWLSLASALLILYGTLFPFRFEAVGELSFFQLLSGLRFQRTSRGDLVANLLLYMPLGLCLMLSMPARSHKALAVVWSVVLGTLLSVGVEMLQVHAVSRVSSLTDVVLNAIGTFAGALLAIGYLAIGTAIRVPGIAPGRPEPAPLGVLLLWLGFRLAPFVPTIDWQKWKDALKPLLDPSVGTIETLRYLAGWLVVGYAIRQIWRREYALQAIAAAVLLVLAGRLVIVGKTLVADELLALVLCIPLSALLIQVADRRRSLLLALLLAAVITLQGLKPFAFSPTAGDFSWVPFKSSITSSIEVNYLVMLEKCFWYFALVWLLARRLRNIVAASLLTALLLGALEFAQVWLPGRSAEITDPLLALASGALLGLLGVGVGQDAPRFAAQMRSR